MINCFLKVNQALINSKFTLWLGAFLLEVLLENHLYIRLIFWSLSLSFSSVLAVSHQALCKQCFKWTYLMHAGFFFPWLIFPSLISLSFPVLCHRLVASLFLYFCISASFLESVTTNASGWEEGGVRGRRSTFESLQRSLALCQWGGRGGGIKTENFYI